AEEPAAVVLQGDVNNARQQGLQKRFVATMHVHGEDGTGFKAATHPDSNPAGGEIPDLARPLQAARTSQRLAGTFQLTWIAHPGSTVGMGRIVLQRLWKGIRCAHRIPQPWKKSVGSLSQS